MNTLVKGNTWRRAVDLWLGAAGFITQVRGLGYPGDDIAAIRGPVALSVEAKNHRAINLAGWVDQAEGNATGAQIPVVVAHRKGKSSVDDAYVVMSGRAFARLIERLKEAL